MFPEPLPYPAPSPHVLSREGSRTCACDAALCTAGGTGAGGSAGWRHSSSPDGSCTTTSRSCATAASTKRPRSTEARRMASAGASTAVWNGSVLWSPDLRENT
jgi:hypothetical protein